MGSIILVARKDERETGQMTVRIQSDWPEGEVVCFKHSSGVLRDNIWSDPAERDFHVYLPSGYSESGSAFAALWDFAAFTNSGPGHLNWRNQGENLPQRLDRLIGTGAMPIPGSPPYVVNPFRLGLCC